MIAGFEFQTNNLHIIFVYLLMMNTLSFHSTLFNSFETANCVEDANWVIRKEVIRKEVKNEKPKVIEEPKKEKTKRVRKKKDENERIETNE